ncbi:unnamed protein product [Enterobius vermicularis]|uniref:Phlebovirus_G2 domain-containing protein n=1 Tax=Enterobius vermicularis TaxID=51028 RepID=A0A0N4VCP3_ENTVE|nr:unnamed protein product [Enterobius vermicularis]
MIRSQIDIHRWSTHHTCENNDDCNRRLKTFWTPYEFVCCTTVLCDESYGDYYLVHSGCSTKRHCKPMIQIKDYTRFAARMEKAYFDLFDTSLEGDCPATRQKMTVGIPNATLITPIPPPTTTTPATLRTIPTVTCKCTNPSECCVHIECSDSLQNGIKQYKLDVECIPQCTNLVTKIGTQYTFYLPAPLWEKRNVYEHDQSAPAVEESCRETR